MANGKVSKGYLIFSGVMFFLLGLIMFYSPVQTLVSFIWYISIFTFVVGIMGLFAYFQDKEAGGLAVSIIDIIFGAFLMFSAGAKVSLLIFLPYFIGGWALVRGIMAIVAAIKGRKENSKWWLYIIWGVLVILASLVIFMNPYVSTTLIVKYSGIFFVIFGIATFIKGIAMFFTKKDDTGVSV